MKKHDSSLEDRQCYEALGGHVKHGVTSLSSRTCNATFMDLIGYQSQHPICKLHGREILYGDTATVDQCSMVKSLARNDSQSMRVDWRGTWADVDKFNDLVSFLAREYLHHGYTTAMNPFVIGGDKYKTLMRIMRKCVNRTAFHVP